MRHGERPWAADGLRQTLSPREAFRAPMSAASSHSAAVSPGLGVCQFPWPEEAETQRLGVGYKQIVPSGRRLLDKISLSCRWSPVHQRVRLCRDNEATRLGVIHSRVVIIEKGLVCSIAGLGQQLRVRQRVPI